MLVLQWDSVVDCLDGLNKAHDAFNSLSLTAASGAPHSGSGEDSEEHRMEAIVAGVESALDGAMASSNKAMHLPVVTVVAACVREGSRLLFGPAGAAQTTCDPAALPPAAFKQLAVLAGAMSKGLGHWAKHTANVFGTEHFQPSTLMWARAMLHLFQWVLHRTGHGGDAPVEGVYLPGGLAGYSEGAGPQLQDGPAAACSGLLLAQHISALHEDTAVGALPATMALARLLMAEGSCDVLCQQCLATRAFLPARFPAAAAGRLTAAQAQVEHLQFGSRPAWEVARDHLEAVLQSVSVHGKAIHLGSVHSPVHVGDSVSVWEAVLLWRHANTRLKRWSLREAWAA